MERNEVLDKMNKIFVEVLNLDEVNLTDETTANDIDEWNSLAHMQIVVALEHEFGVKFKGREVMKWKNVGQIVDTILSKL